MHLQLKGAKQQIIFGIDRPQYRIRTHMKIHELIKLLNTKATYFARRMEELEACAYKET